ncbi:hypothetical protein [Candidatus Gromoviella agglomerans]|uniref:hypothetical protein n=1 Tax=Candidatus Gromoviella agglomerans TaxID=2806609 RepID=UPI001E62FFBD|nr:hypothetical protein [Candidatus Gromoviella agglomerans]UFX98237.1 Smc super family protein [Candidatus Gromoviella agglomerans]
MKKQLTFLCLLNLFQSQFVFCNPVGSNARYGSEMIHEYGVNVKVQSLFKRDMYHDDMSHIGICNTLRKYFHGLKNNKSVDVKIDAVWMYLKRIELGICDEKYFLSMNSLIHSDEGLDQISRLRGEVDRVKGVESELRKQILIKDQENVRLQKESNARFSENVNLLKDLQKVLKENSQLKNGQNENEQLRQQLVRKEREMQALQKEYERSLADNEQQLVGLRQQHEQQVAEKDRELEDLRKQLIQKDQQLSAKDDEIAQLKKQLSSLEGQLLEKDNELDDIKKWIEDVSKRIDEFDKFQRFILQQQNNSSQVVAQKIHDHLDKISKNFPQKSLHDLYEKCLGLKSNAPGAVQENPELSHQLQKIDATILAARSMLNLNINPGLIAEYEKLIAEFNKFADDYNRIVGTLSDDIDECIRYLQAREEERIALEFKNNHELNAMIKELQNENLQLRQEKNALWDQNNALYRENLQLRQEKSTLWDQNSKLRDKNIQLMQDSNAFTAKKAVSPSTPSTSGDEHNFGNQPFEVDEFCDN